MKATFSTILVLAGVAATRGAQAPARAEIARPTPITAPLRALSTNPNYFADGRGKAVYLTGSHTWNDFQDWGADGSPQPFDFAAYVKMLVAHMNLAAMVPRRDLSSTGHALASAGSANPEFLVYAPAGGNFTVNLSGVGGTLAVEWMDPATGSRIAGANVSGGASRAFNPPFTGDAVLHLRGNTSGTSSK